MLTSFGNICAFLASTIIPIPALRCFSFQTAILISFSTASILFLFPAIAIIDCRRSRVGRRDLFCCFHGKNYSSSDCETCDNKLNESTIHHKINYKKNSINKFDVKKCLVHSLPTDRNNIVTTLISDKSVTQPFLPKKTKYSSKCVCSDNMREQSVSEMESCKIKDKRVWNLTTFSGQIYAPILQKKPVKVFVVFAFLIFLVISISGLLKVNDGLELTDLVPRNTIEYRFLNYQSKYFSFFNMFAVTQGNFEYPTNQRLLHEYHHAFTRIGQIIKNDDGGLPEFWLTLFRDWLISLQEAFDRDWKNGCITQENWYPNASDDGILAYKLLVQTGRVDNPVDKTLVIYLKNYFNILN